MAASHTLGPDAGTIQVHTFREGVAQRVGHDLVIDVAEWSATVQIDDAGAPDAIALDVDSGSLQVREGHNGLKPLSDKDRNEIRKNIDEKVLRRRPIAFRSSSVTAADGRLSIVGELSLGGTARESAFELRQSPDGRVTGTLPVTQTEFGIKPYSAMLGALKVRDTVEIVLDVALPPTT